MKIFTVRQALLLAAVATAALLAYGAWSFRMSALDEPGPTPTFLATQAKRYYIGRAARQVAAAPPSSAMSIPAGEMAYRGECQNCHGLDGRTPTDIGRGLYPRVPSLASHQVQRWTDAELFVIVKYGIRHSGMPGFGRIISDEQIWNLVHFVRSLRKMP